MPHVEKKKRGREYELSVQKNRGHWEDPIVEKQENCVNTMGISISFPTKNTTTNWICFSRNTREHQGDFQFLRYPCETTSWGRIRNHLLAKFQSAHIHRLRITTVSM